jgi:hypothetical protein
MASNIVYGLLFLLVAFVCYLVVFGVPAPLSGLIPVAALDALGIEDASLPQAVASDKPRARPEVTAQGVRGLGAALPVNAAVEDVVSSVRPETYLTAQDSAAFRAQSVVERIPYQKTAFWVMLATVYSATPDQGIGYLGIRFQSPDYYYLHGATQDRRTFILLQDRLRARVATLAVADSTELTDGGVEFTNYGHIKVPPVSGKGMELIPSGKEVNQELLALRDLAKANQVQLAGLDKIDAATYGAYRRLLVRASTTSDYPSLFNFAEALRASDLRIGVLSLTARPETDRSGNTSMQSAIDFVLYSTLSVK